MMISIQKKFLYIHIFKTGGTSLTRILAPYIEEQNRNPNSQFEGENWQSSWHFDTAQHAKLHRVLPLFKSRNPDLNPKDFFCFTFVRNPYSWILSVWSNHYRLPPANFEPELIDINNEPFGRRLFHYYYPDGSLNSYLRFLLDISDSKNNIIKSYFGAADQCAFIENSDGIEFDFIGKFENYNQDAINLLEQLNIPIPAEIPHNNYKAGAERKDYLKFYDMESIAIVNHLFARDFYQFGYDQIDSI